MEEAKNSCLVLCATYDEATVQKYLTAVETNWF